MLVSGIFPNSANFPVVLGQRRSWHPCGGYKTVPGKANSAPVAMAFDSLEEADASSCSGGWLHVRWVRLPMELSWTSVDASVAVVPLAICQVAGSFDRPRHTS